MKRQITKVVLVVTMAMAWNWPTTSRAENPIHTMVDSQGRVVFVNAPQPNPPIALGSSRGSSKASPTPAAPEATGRRPSDSIAAVIESVSHTHGIDPDLVAAVVKVESNFDRFARSPKGALGLMQLIPETGWRYGVRDFYDPQQNIEGGVRYLKFLLEMFDGNVDLSLAAYNAGENAVKRAGRIPAIQETRDYVRKIRAIYKKTMVPVLTAQQKESVPEAVSGGANANTSAIFRTVDERGVIRFSNIAPPN